VFLHVESLNKNEKKVFWLEENLFRSIGQRFMRQHIDTLQIFKNAMVFSQTNCKYKLNVEIHGLPLLPLIDLSCTNSKGL